MINGKRGPLFVILFAALMAGAGNGISIVAFPWLVLQLVSGGLTGAALITILWHYRRSRSRTREMG